jgi:multidrug efflux pump subunit AcrB
MPKESSPDINIPFFTITAVYPGADSQTVQQQITQKIENKLPSVENISTFNSISANNVSAITVQFKR